MSENPEQDGSEEVKEIVTKLRRALEKANREVVDAVESLALAIPEKVEQEPADIELLTVTEAADFLDVHEATIYRRLSPQKDGSPPEWGGFSFKVGNSWRIKKGPMLEHLQRHQISRRESDPDPMPKPKNARERFNAMMDEELRRVGK